MKRTGTIYHIFNTKTGKCYIGQTWRSVKERWIQHQGATSNCVKLSNSIKKHGISSFIISTLTSNLRTQEDVNKAETYWIFYFNSVEDGYNLTYGGANNRFSEETRKKLSKAHSGEKNHWFGKHHTEDTKKKIRSNHADQSGPNNGMFGKTGKNNPNFGKHPSKEILNRRVKGIRAAKARPFQCFKEGSPYDGKIYQNQIDAIRELGGNLSGIGDVLHGRQKTTKGYTFKYIGSKE